MSLSVLLSVDWSLAVYSVLSIFLAYVISSTFLFALKAIRMDRQLSHIPAPHSRFPFSPLLDLIRGSPWDTIMDWMNISHHQIHPSYLTTSPSGQTPGESEKKKVSDILKFQFGSVCYVIISSPSMIQHVLITNRSNYRKDPEAYSKFLPLLGEGLITSEGRDWELQRSLIAPVFRNTILAETAQTSIAAVDRLTHKLFQLLQTQPRNAWTELEFGEEFRHLTLQVIGHSVLSMSPAECDAVFPALYLPIAMECNQRVYRPYREWLPSSTNRKVSAALNKLDGVLTELIQRRLQSLTPLMEDKFSKSKFKKDGLTEDEWQNQRETVFRQTMGRDIDILDRVLLSVLDAAITVDSGVLRQLRDQMKTFIFAGHETSSMMLTWALHETLQHPRVLSTILQESVALWGKLQISDSGEVISSRPSPTFEQILTDLPYTTATLKEATRKYSLVPVVTREAIRDDVIDGYRIPASAKVGVLIKGAHYREDYWDSPLEFLPERFLDPAKVAKHHPCQFLTFIAGARNCVGQHFALLEARIVLSRLLQLFQLRNEKWRENGVYHPFLIPVMPSNGMKLELRQNVDQESETVHERKSEENSASAH